MREVIITPFYKDLTIKFLFLRSAFGSSSIISEGTRYIIEILHQCGRRVKPKIQKVLFVEVTREKLLKGFFCPPSWIGLKGSEIVICLVKLILLGQINLLHPILIIFQANISFSCQCWLEILCYFYGSRCSQETNTWIRLWNYFFLRFSPLCIHFSDRVWSTGVMICLFCIKTLLVCV